MGSSLRLPPYPPTTMGKFGLNLLIFYSETRMQVLNRPPLDLSNIGINKRAVDKLDWMDLVKGLLSGQLS